MQAGHQRFGFAVLFQCLFHRDGNLNCFLKCQQMASFSVIHNALSLWQSLLFSEASTHHFFHSPYQCLHRCCNLCHLPKCPQTNTRTFKPHVPSFWQDATGPRPVSHFQTQFHSSTDVPDIVQNQPRSYIVLGDCVRFRPNGSGLEASQMCKIHPAHFWPMLPSRYRPDANWIQHVYWGGFSVQYTTNKGRPTC